MTVDPENTNAYPVDYELLPPQEPEVPAIHGHEEVTILSGIQQAIANFRAGRAERKLETLESNDHVIRHNPVEAHNLRGFKSSEIDPKDRPIGLIQKGAYEIRRRQARIKRGDQRQRYRLDEVYGTPRPVTEASPRAPRLETGTAAAERWNKSVEKLEKLDRGQAASFDHSVRMSRKEAKTMQKSERKYHAAGQRMRRIDERSQAAIQGDTLPAEIRAQRIEKQRRKVQRLRGE